MSAEKTFSVVRSQRPQQKKPDSPAERERRIALMQARYESGLDLFDGSSLSDKDAEDWLRIADGRSEVETE